ncbi:MAG: formimidoylglutamate deiminase [Hydrocarboniphaga sp.]|uniref:formimidoylglutamate deiminase n=1 Tax=Hydrocarboniphaga sp. TaxID=2033016 RepID=UPI0026043B1E|nr:formimidoylglutamate deiminase [Hydrocarboniphaga sp.]MDB5969044.1 formimidoylglutamate deiminase [Hydrocarboniphaga sp.]
MRAFSLEHALLPQGWASKVLIEVDAAGMIASVTTDSEAGNAERIAGCVLPGMPNLHSHAFQRALAGLTEKGGPAHDSFWSWREQMYRFLERLTPDDVEAIATRLYIEMLEAGYTTVAEFQYLHHDPKGEVYSQADEMSQRLIAAAKTAGIALTLLPVFYAHSQFGGEPPTEGQRRFIHSVNGFNRLVSDLHAQLIHEPQMRLGIAPHSLRAVTPHELAAVVAHFEILDPRGPIHIHAAEQRKEVEDSLAWSGCRPVAWLLEHAGLDPRWCLIHATHMGPDEVAGLAATGAVAGLCPSTEADLGDGFFAAPEYLAARGQFGIGGDSHVGVDPFFELRLFEYGQRLRAQRRNVLAGETGASLGEALYRRAAIGGARAVGQYVGSLEVGRRADWVVLNGDDAALAEHAPQQILDAAIFGPARQPVRDVMVAGQWRVRDGRHAAAETSKAAYRASLRRLLQ